MIQAPAPSSEPRWKYTVSSVVAFSNQSNQEAFALELKSRGIPFSRELKFPVVYKGRPLRCEYRPDFICFESVIVELKALGQLSSVAESQLINYLKVTGYHVGLLLNFGRKRLEQRRFVLS